MEGAWGAWRRQEWVGDPKTFRFKFFLMEAHSSPRPPTVSTYPQPVSCSDLAVPSSPDDPARLPVCLSVLGSLITNNPSILYTLSAMPPTPQDVVLTTTPHISSHPVLASLSPTPLT